MVTDNERALPEPRESNDRSASSASRHPSPLGQDIDRSQLPPSLQPPRTPSTLSGFSSSQESLIKDIPSPPRETKPHSATDGSDIDEDGEEMSVSRPSMHRPTDGRSQQPLLNGDILGRSSYDALNGSARPAFVARSSTFRSRDQDLEGKSATRKKYTYAGFFLLLSLVSFTIQTETAVYIQQTLGWQKAYCML